MVFSLTLSFTVFYLSFSFCLCLCFFVFLVVFFIIFHFVFVLKCLFTYVICRDRRVGKQGVTMVQSSGTLRAHIAVSYIYHDEDLDDYCYHDYGAGDWMIYDYVSFLFRRLVNTSEMMTMIIVMM